MRFELRFIFRSKTTSILFLWSMCSGLAHSSPMTPSDWFCTRSEGIGEKLFPPVITRIPDRSCSGTKDQAHSVCSMSAHCIFLTSEIRKELLAHPTADREKVIVSRHGKDQKSWINGVVTCSPNPSAAGNGSITCPPPELCKNAPGISVQAALLREPESQQNSRKNPDSDARDARDGKK